MHEFSQDLSYTSLSFPLPLCLCLSPSLSLSMSTCTSVRQLQSMCLHTNKPSSQLTFTVCSVLHMSWVFSARTLHLECHNMQFHSLNILCSTYSTSLFLNFQQPLSFIYLHPTCLFQSVIKVFFWGKNSSVSL